MQLQLLTFPLSWRPEKIESESETEAKEMAIEWVDRGDRVVGGTMSVSQNANDILLFTYCIHLA